ncbi:hypothetical protein M0812_01308 [Anaeramoeba flamelloides]|uniref:Uncharacterized protein n=1 Tax=Anaeramoeba flamelloides TaxID=1746091 RepID=A0AAV8A3F3_9EUKA|nr:hypothetical protein M0812_01308 [Anaeramoeba flamelloides]
MKKYHEEIENKQQKKEQIGESDSETTNPIQTRFDNLTSCLFSHSNENPSEETNNIFKTFQNNSEMKLVFLVGASGVGKTWTLIDFAFQNYSLFFNFSLFSGEIYKDPNMKILVDDIEDIYSGLKLTEIRSWHNSKLLKACKRVEIDIISRLLALIIFLIQEEEEKELKKKTKRAIARKIIRNLHQKCFFYGKYNKPNKFKKWLN